MGAARKSIYGSPNKSPDTLLVGVTSGTPPGTRRQTISTGIADTPLPAGLKGRFPAEPKWVDLTAYRQGADPRNARFIEAGADFAAAIRGMPKEDLLSQEVRQQRRALSLAVSAAALLLLLAVGAVTAGIIARTQQLRAEKNFAAAESTVRGLIFGMVQSLRDVEGIRIENLDKILTQTRQTVERLTETDPDNPVLLADKATMLDEFARTYLAAGNLPTALKNAEESVGILRRLIENNPGNFELVRNLAIGLNRVGDVKRAQGDNTAALTAYEESLAIDRHRAEVETAKTQAQNDITVDLDRIADLKLYLGDRARALAAYEESLALRRRLVESDPSDTQWRRNLVVSLGKIGDMKRDAGQSRDALSLYEESLLIARALADFRQGQYRLAA